MKLGIVGLPNVGKSTLLTPLPKLERRRPTTLFAPLNPTPGSWEYRMGGLTGWR